MSIWSTLSRSFAYLALLAIIILLFLAFVTVPFHGPDTESDRTQVKLGGLDYPTTYEAGFEQSKIASRGGIIDPPALMDEHVSHLVLSDRGYIDYSHNSTNHTVHWSDENTILHQSNNEYFVNQDGDIQARDKGNISVKAEKIQSRYAEYSYYSRFGNSRSAMHIEKTIVEVISQYDYSAVNAWKSDGTLYIKYRSETEPIDSSFVISGSGRIHRFTHNGDTSIEYETKLDQSAPPFFKPTWVLGNE